MLVITLRKLWAKKWMVLCMLLGCTLLIATVISLPLYENAAYNTMLRDEFQMAYEKSGEWPAKFYTQFVMRQKTGGAELFEREAVLENMGDALGVTTKESVVFYKTVERQLRSTMGRDDAKAHYKIHISMLSDLEPHVEILSGEMYSEDGYAEDGYLEIMITSDCMVRYGYLLGEELQFSSFRDKNGDLLKVRIVGIIAPKEEDFYWEIGTDALDDACFISEDAFREIFLTEDINNYKIDCTHCYLFEYDDLRAEQAEHILEILQDEAYEGQTFDYILEEYVAKLNRISASLVLLQVPMLILLAVFLFMLSKQMYEVERNEIAVIKSRGSSGSQLFRLYFYQIGILTGVGLLLGVPLGIYFFQMIGSASGFLEFGVRRKMDIIFNGKVYLYLAVALAVTIGTMSLPAVKHSKVSIVNLKQNRVKSKRPLWEVCFLDFICLAVGLYGYNSFSRTEDLIAESVLLNEPLDPLLYISSSLLVVGVGLLYLRILPLVVKVVYKLGERHWKPASYSSFLEIMRSSRKQQFIMLFLILNIAFGIYHATVANTITDNALDNTEYLVGVDAIIREKWRDNVESALIDPEIVMRFFEADYGKYETLKCAESYTKVYYDDTSEETDRVSVSSMGMKVQMLLINSKEFGEITWVDEELLDEHYYTYLNRLAENENGFIVSRSYAERMGFEEGSSITVNYLMYMEEGNSAGNTVWIKLMGEIVGIVDYWPGYTAEEVYLGDGGEIVHKTNYLIVGSYIPFENQMGVLVQPYEVWIDLNDSAEPEEVGQWINEQNIPIERYRNRKQELERTITDPLLQGTNGILTMEFIVMILLCMVGYLVYWIMSIRDRELMFGVLRAFGMHKRELFGMLMLEQLFSGVLTTVVAIFLGQKTAEMFVPLMVTAYTAAQQVLPMKLVVDSTDLFRLYGCIALALLVSLLILVGFVFKMKVAESLKLGED